ncbi:MAG: type II toxin-antitoxin system VapC family toxin [Methylobacillus sp.]|jgi:PIN domain nuclease of toxin-antitoxin system|nr:type II toxin-antitoxin system VapC family toxin [Methylobacillus sp.]
MRLLLDTHVFLWAVSDDKRLSGEARKRILDADEVFVSSASIWEASIKAGLGKLDVDVNLLIGEITKSGFSELPVRALHAVRLRDLPHIHRDPFDRLLIAQAMTEPLALVTHDPILAGYTDLVIVV